MNGFINLNKPSEWTSHDCVAKLRTILRTKQIGHGGTLDPMATGVLPIAVGKATRLLQFLPKRKSYTAHLQFGIRTNTDDITGEEISRQFSGHLTPDDFLALLPQFKGRIQQIPPQFSAIQRGGKRLYDLARQGQIVDVPPREVEIFHIELREWISGEFPVAVVSIDCGEGTYIRSIARDLGNLLQVGGTLAGLTRTLSCGFFLENSLNLSNITEKTELLPLDSGLSHLPGINLNDAQVKSWCQGQKLEISHFFSVKNFLKVYDKDNHLLGIGTVSLSSDDSINTIIQPKIVFSLGL